MYTEQCFSFNGDTESCLRVKMCQQHNYFKGKTLEASFKEEEEEQELLRGKF